jgi:integrase
MTDAEIDIDRKVWTIPASRAKNNVTHDVPLSDQALALLASMKRAR